MVMSGKTREKGFVLIGVLLFLVLLSAMAITLSYTVRTKNGSAVATRRVTWPITMRKPAWKK